MTGRVLPFGLCAALVSAGCRDAPSEAAPDRAAQARVRKFWAVYGAATTRRGAGDCAGAATLYREGLALDPRHEDSFYYLGHCLRELGRPLESRRAFEALVEVNPGSARGHLAIGALLASPDPAEPLDLGEAERRFRRAREINGEESGPIVRLAEVLIVAGRSAEARRWLEAAVRMNPKSLEAAFLASYVAWEAGDAAAARAFAGKARSAALADAPVRGVLGEGDRRGSNRTVAPPLARPMGRTLFEAAASVVRAAAAPDRPLPQADLERAWRAAREARLDYQVRAAAQGSREAGPGAERLRR